MQGPEGKDKHAVQEPLVPLHSAEGGLAAGGGVAKSLPAPTAVLLSLCSRPGRWAEAESGVLSLAGG